MFQVRSGEETMKNWNKRLLRTKNKRKSGPEVDEKVNNLLQAKSPGHTSVWVSLAVVLLSCLVDLTSATSSDFSEIKPILAQSSPIISADYLASERAISVRFGSNTLQQFYDAFLVTTSPFLCDKSAPNRFNYSVNEKSDGIRILDVNPEVLAVSSEWYLCAIKYYSGSADLTAQEADWLSLNSIQIVQENGIQGKPFLLQHLAIQISIPR